MAVKKYLIRAWSDTTSFFGWSWKQIVWPLLFIFGLYLHSQWSEDKNAPQQEILLWVTYTVAPATAFASALFFWNLVLAPYRIQKDRADAAEKRIRRLELKHAKGRRLNPEQQLYLAEIMRGIDLGQERLNVFYFQSSEECADLACDIANAAKMAGWESTAATNVFGDDPNTSDVNIIVSGESYSPPAAAALEAGLREVGLAVHKVKIDRGDAKISIYVGRPSSEQPV